MGTILRVRTELVGGVAGTRRVGISAFRVQHVMCIEWCCDVFVMARRLVGELAMAKPFIGRWMQRYDNDVEEERGRRFEYILTVDASTCFAFLFFGSHRNDRVCVCFSCGACSSRSKVQSAGSILDPIPVPCALQPMLGSYDGLARKLRLRRADGE